MKFTLDTTLPEMLNVASVEAAAGHRFAAAVFAAFYSAFGWGFDQRFVALVVIAGLIIYRHRSNISNLMAGREKRIEVP